MDNRDLLYGNLLKQEADLDAQARAVNDAMQAALKRYAAPGQPITRQVARRVMRAVQPVLDRLYGARKGDRGAVLARIIERDAQTVRIDVTERAIMQARRDLITAGGRDIVEYLDRRATERE